MERFINILVADSNEKYVLGLKEILSGGGNNVITASDFAQACWILKKRDIGIILLNIDDLERDTTTILTEIDQHSKNHNLFKILLTSETNKTSLSMLGAHNGAVDLLLLPIHPHLVRFKVDIFKSMYFKNMRIHQLLENIFPGNILENFGKHNKFSPTRVDNGIVLFTDFVDFSAKARDLSPMRLLKQLEHYFKRFDEIIDRYKLEKIKTIGDAYMALAGVTEANPEPAVRACLAAIELRDAMVNEGIVAKALGKHSWDIRIGLHSGPLVAGVIGSSKMSFDVWGDTVNIAARAESATLPGTISITQEIANQVKEFFNLEHRGEIGLAKRGGQMDMYFLEDIKRHYCLYGEGKIASTTLRQRCGLSPIDFAHMRKEILNRLKALLPSNLIYHDVTHTLNVEKAAIRIAELEGLDDEEILLLRTAVLYHDAGFIEKYDQNEQFAISMVENALPKYGYSSEQIALVSGIIHATQSGQEPDSLLEKIMCDADHDYLGRADYYAVADKLRAELENHSHSMNEDEWIQFQLHYLENVHEFYTETARNLRLQAKNIRINELKEKRKKYENLH